MQAIDQLLRLDRGDLAREYLERLSGMSLNDAEMASLQQQFGTASMIRLARAAELSPAGAEFSSAVLQAAERVLQDPQRLAAWVTQLGSAQRREQYMAAEQLMRAGAHAVPPLLRGIASSSAADQTLRQNSFTLIRHLKGEALDPILAVMETPEGRLRAASIAGLSVIGTPRELPYLVGSLLAPKRARRNDGPPRKPGSGLRDNRPVGPTPSRCWSGKPSEPTAAMSAWRPMRRIGSSAGRGIPRLRTRLRSPCAASMRPC